MHAELLKTHNVARSSYRKTSILRLKWGCMIRKLLKYLPDQMRWEFMRSKLRLPTEFPKELKIQKNSRRPIAYYKNPTSKKVLQKPTTQECVF